MMRRTVLAALALAATGASPVTLACDMHGSGENFFLAYIDYRDMTESEQRAAEQRAIEQFHAQQLETARSRFVGRFKPDPLPQETQPGASDQQAI